jgi:inosine-uridine nucleoside N-ribohydrolase
MEANRPTAVSMGRSFFCDFQGGYARCSIPWDYSLTGYVGDEIAGAALIDPSVIKGQKQLHMHIDIDHGASYGKTLFWDSGAKVPSYLRLANMQFDIDVGKFYKLYIDLMTRRPPGQKQSPSTLPH